jgi:carbonic anhydrase
MGALGATSAAFSYDPNSEYGPEHWGDLLIDGNQCNGSSNSPVAIESGGCDRYEDYKFSVSLSVLLQHGVV